MNINILDTLIDFMMTLVPAEFAIGRMLRNTVKCLILSHTRQHLNSGMCGTCTERGK